MMQTQNYWQLIAQYEEQFYKELKGVFEPRQSVSFASFHLRSFTLPGSRRDIVTVDNSPKDGDSEARLATELLGEYVSACGAARTLNSLLINLGKYDGVTIEVGQPGPCSVQITSKIVVMRLPQEFLFADWSKEKIKEGWDARLRVTPAAGTVVWPYDKLEQIALQSLLRLLAENKPVFDELCRCLVDSEPASLSRAQFEVLRHWSSAIVGIAPFLAVFGESFDARRVEYPAKEKINTATGITDIMSSAMTWISKGKLESPETQLLQAVDGVKKAVTLDLTGEPFSASVEAAKGRAGKFGIPERGDGLPLKRLPDLIRILQIAQKLAGAKEEKRPLSFIFFCGLETEVLRQHVLLGSENEWRLETILEIPRAAFESDPDVAIESATRDIKKNSGLVQVPGRALFFGPTDCYPDAIVDLVPFEPALEQKMLIEYSRRIGVAISISSRGIEVFGNGALICRGRGNPVTWTVGTDTSALTLELLVSKIIEILAPRVEPRDRISRVAATALRVKEYGLGCLLFLKTGDVAAKAHPMADLWIYGDSFPRQIENVGDDSLLAMLAGMDGEMAIDLVTGKYGARLEHIVPPEKMLSVRLIGESGLESNPEFQEYLNRMPELCKKHAVEIESLGTRHMKALRITRAYPDMLAVTVSSDGFLRIWKDGYIREQWI